ncbi:MAG: DUF4199 domain-containing protein [Bacteroides sp.]
MTDNRSFLQKYAMHFGTYMGIYWVLKFILFPIGLSIPFLLFLFIGLTLGVPFMGYYYVRMYRNKVCGGYINFVQAWIFTIFMYLFASLLAAVAHYLYFGFIDNGYIAHTYLDIINTAAKTPLSGIEPYVAQMRTVIELISSMTPIDITLQLLSQNVFYGTLLAIPTALIVMKRNKQTTESQS